MNKISHVASFLKKMPVSSQYRLPGTSLPYSLDIANDNYMLSYSAYKMASLNTVIN